MATAKRVRNAGTSTGMADRKRDSESKGRTPKTNTWSKKGDRLSVTAARRKAPLEARKETGQGEGSAHGRRNVVVSDASSGSFRSGSKGNTILGLLKQRDGATIAELVGATGWQAHSVRGFLSGSLKKKLGIAIASEKGDDGQRRYRVAS